MDKLDNRVEIDGYMFGLMDGYYSGKGTPQPWDKVDPSLLEAGNKLVSQLNKKGIQSECSYVGDSWVDVKIKK